MEVPAVEVKRKKPLLKPAVVRVFNIENAGQQKIDISSIPAPVKQQPISQVNQEIPAVVAATTATTSGATSATASGATTGEKKKLKKKISPPANSQTQETSEHPDVSSQVPASSNTEHAEHKKQDHSSHNGEHAHPHTDHSHKKHELKEEQKEESKSVDPQPTVSQTNGLEKAANSSVKASFDLISYFLDKDITFEIEEDDRIPFNKRLNFFLNRKYENQNKQDQSRNKTQTKNGGQYGNQRSYNQGNSKPGEALQMQRGDSKKLTNTPQMQKQHSSNSGMIKRGEEDLEVTQLKMKIKAQSALFLEKMRSEKLDSFKKQISDIRMELNILTPTNFDIIKVRLLDLALSDSILCEYVVEGIIEKARTQKTYSVVYANLCKYMIDESKRRFPKKEGQEDDEKQKIFKNHLYSNIQDTFEGEKDIYNNKMSFIKSKKLEDITSEEEKTQYYDDKKKRDMLNVKFIGNLFLNRSLNAQILRICCGQLLSKFVEGYCKYEHKSDQIEEALYENDLDALVALFEQTGQKMQEKHLADTKKTDNSKLVSEFINDIEKKEYKKDSDLFENLNFDDYFTVFEWLQKNKKVSPRLYSLIVNLIERKNENWKDRLSTQTGPVSLENLHKQHEQDMKQSQQELAKYEQEQKQGKGRNYKGNHNHKHQQTYVAANTQKNREPAQTNGKYNEKSGIVRAKEFWGYLDLKIKLQEDYTVQNAVNDFKQLREECEPLVFGEILLKTVYDCNVIHKENRLLAACEATSFLKPNEFLKAFSERLNRSKDETSDFPLFLDFLSQLFLHVYRKGEIKFSGLQVRFKPEYDDSDKEDVLFVYKNFFEECIQILKVEKAPFDVAAFLKEEIDSVMTADEADSYATFVKNMTK